VDVAHYTSHYVPAFEAVGYLGLYKKRTNDKSDGCAIFYKNDRVRLIRIRI
jgi:protein angel